MTLFEKTSLRSSLALWAGLLACAAVNAENQPNSALDFELSDGHRFVQLSRLPAQTTVINFWRADCPPCLREMPALAALARSGKVRVITIALQKPVETLSAPSAIQAALTPPMHVLHGPGEPRGLLARFGNRVGALPHTLVLDDQRRPCTQRTGEITSDWLEQAVTNCTKAETT